MYETQSSPSAASPLGGNRSKEMMSVTNLEASVTETKIQSGFLPHTHTGKPSQARRKEHIFS